MSRFTTITLAMVAVLALAMVLGGPFAALALAYVTLFTFVMDRLGLPETPDQAAGEFPAGDGLAVILGLTHFPLLAGGVWAIGSGHMGGIDKAMLFIALSLYLGQVSNSNAHELIHRAPRWMRRLGTANYVSILYGQHASAHLHVHHIHAATDHDPNSARLGEGFYRYLARAWIGELREGWRAETRRRKGKAGLHPFAWYMIGSIASLAAAFAIAGWTGVLVLVGLSAYAQVQLLLSDYVQHYGLRRAPLAKGKWAPVGPEHSWNAPQPFSAALMLNAPRHSDHHARPATPYPGLNIDRATMPILPHSLPVMAVLALLPPVWRRLMDKRARKWAASGAS